LDRFVHKLISEQRTPPSTEEFRDWENDNHKLPETYLRFMTAFDGGFIYPNAFYHNTKDPDDWLDDVDDITHLSHLYSWSAFKKEQSYSHQAWGQDFVAIGEEIASGNILMKVAGDETGAIFFWYRNNDSWDDDDGPVPIGKISDSFEAFILKDLFTPSDGPDGRWESFFEDGTAEALSF